MATAAARGWGTGYPNCQRGKCIWITAGGIRLLVRAEVAPIFKGFCDELVQRGYPLGDVADDWGFACRAIRGSTAPSNHSWGLAIDLNATTNPMSSTLRTDFPKWAVALGEKKYGLHWGGRYQTRPDAMHWEWLGTPGQAIWLTAALAALPSTEQPPEPPSQEYAMDFLDLSKVTFDEATWFTGRHVDNLKALMIPVLAAGGRGDLIMPLLPMPYPIPTTRADIYTRAAFKACQDILRFAGALQADQSDEKCGPASWRALIEF